MEKQRDRLKAFRKRKKAEREAANKPKTTKPKADTSQLRAMSKPGAPSGTGTRKPAAPKKPTAKKPTAKKPTAKKPKPTKAQTDRFYSSSSKGSIANKEKAKSNFFRSSSGLRGSNVPSNPKLMIQPKKKPKKNRRGRTVKRQDDYRLF